MKINFPLINEFSVIDKDREKHPQNYLFIGAEFF